MTFQLRIEELGEEHLAPYAALSRIEYGESAAISSERHLRWKFLKNPQGKSVGVHLYAGSELVGRMTALTRIFIFRGRSYRAAHVVDFLVHPRWRGMAALLQLVQGLKQISGFDFYLIMAPNATGAAVWEKFWKMRACFEMDVAVAPLHPARLLQARGKLPAWIAPSLIDAPWRLALRGACRIRLAFSPVEIEAELAAPSELESLSHSNFGDRVIGLRSAEYLQWRYRTSPFFQYQFLSVRSNKQLLGYIVTRRATQEGVDCLFVVDAFGLPSAPAAAWRGATAFALSHHSGRGAAMGMMIGNMEFGTLSEIKAPPFFPAPPRLLPRKMTVFSEWITSPAFEIVRENLYLMLGDGDVI